MILFVPQRVPQCVKKFRLQQFKGLQSHVARFGPLNDTQTSASKAIPNPFLPQFNSNTGRWHPAKISLRRQADLIKQAKASNTLHLLPSGPKSSHIHAAESLTRPNLGETQQGAEKSSALLTGDAAQEDAWLSPVEWIGKTGDKDVPGSQVGNRLYAAKKRMFKGHKWERVKEARTKKRNVLLRDMAKRVANYKAVSNSSSEDFVPT